MRLLPPLPVRQPQPGRRTNTDILHLRMLRGRLLVRLFLFWGFLTLGFFAPVADSYFVQLCRVLSKASYSDSMSLGNYNRLDHPRPRLDGIECCPSLCDM